MMVELLISLLLCKQRWKIWIWIANFQKNSTILLSEPWQMVHTQLGLSSWIWSFRLTLRPVSKVLNIIWEGVSIFIYKPMQHVRANKELSIFYLAKKLDYMFFFYLKFYMVKHDKWLRMLSYYQDFWAWEGS